MATYDNRSSAGWNYIPIPIEEIRFNNSVDAIFFDNILKGSSYSFEPITDGRSDIAPVIKTVAYNFAFEFQLLADELGTLIPQLEANFINVPIALTVYFSAINLSGNTITRRLDIASGLQLTYKVNKGDINPILSLMLKGTIKRGQLTQILTNWVANLPS